MKNLQKCICTIFLFMAIIAGCKQTTPLPANPQNPGNAPSKPDSGPSNPGNTNPSGKGGGETPITVKFFITDAKGNQVQHVDSGTSHHATVKTKTAVLRVHAEPNGTKIEIEGDETRQHDFTFTADEEEKSVKVVASYNGNSQEHKVTVRYYKGAVKDIIVTDKDGKAMHAISSGDTSYAAGVGTTEATVTVEPLNSTDTVKIENQDTKTQQVKFESGETVKELKVSVTHNGNTENYTVKIYYNDPASMPKNPVLKGITLKNAEMESQIFALRPVFQPYNNLYTVPVPSTVNKIKVEAETEAGLSAEIENGSEHTLGVGDNPIKIKVVQAANPAYAYEYTVTVKKAIAGASNNAALASLELDSKRAGIHKEWIMPPDSFNKTQYMYTCNVNLVCDEFYIKASPEESHAVMTVKANGAAPITLTPDNNQQFKPLKEGLNTFVITVTAEDAATEQIYTIHAKKERASNLLKVFSGTGLNDFYKDFFTQHKDDYLSASRDFTATIDPAATETTITATPEFPADTSMTITINGGNKESFSGTKTINLTSPSTDVIINLNSPKVHTWGLGTYYKLTIKKENSSGDSDNTLKTLEISYFGNGYRFYKIATNEEFDPEKTEYTLTLPNGVPDIRVTAQPNSVKASIEGWGRETTKGFDAPFTTVEIPVVAENGSRKVYKLGITELPAATIKITNITENQPINLKDIPAEGLTVSGTFTNPDDAITEIWVGSSGLPIQKEKGGKWEQARISGDTFTAVLPLSALSTLPNGARDIKAGAFNVRSAPVAVTRVPVTIMGNADISVAQVTVTIEPPLDKENKPIPIPANASMRIYALDDDLWGKGEDVVFASQSISSLNDMNFPARIPLSGIKAGGKCRVEVYVYEKVGKKDSLLYSGVKTVQVNAEQNNSCTVALKHAQ